MIRWSAFEVAKQLDELEEIASQVKPIVAECQAKIKHIEGLPNVPSYITESLMYLDARLAYFLESVTERINSIRKKLPEKELRKEQDRQNLWLRLFDGDEGKANLARQTFPVKAGMSGGKTEV